MVGLSIGRDPAVDIISPENGYDETMELRIHDFEAGDCLRLPRF